MQGQAVGGWEVRAAAEFEFVELELFEVGGALEGLVRPFVLVDVSVGVDYCEILAFLVVEHPWFDDCPRCALFALFAFFG